MSRKFIIMLLFLVITILVPGSLQQVSVISDILQNSNLHPYNIAPPLAVFQPRAHVPENEIPHGYAQLDPYISPYWADSQGRQPSAVPALNLDIFKPQEIQCNRPVEPCNASWPYRSMSGFCNNVINPEFGAAGQPMPRILPPVFDEGLIRLRSITGDLLPNPRTVSLGIRKVPKRAQTDHNVMVMQMGQFVDHDFAVVAEVTDPGNVPKKCSSCTSWKDPGCAPIPIPHEDPFIPPRTFATGEPSCLPFTRNVAVTGRDQNGQPILNQVNSLTAFLDLSTVYGSDECRDKDLRCFNSGHLMELKQPSTNFLKGLPPLDDGRRFSECRSKERKCFRTGEDRNNEHMGILAAHVIFLREHNLIASQLKHINPHWDDSRLYQEARKINIAQYQHIVYSEFLPALIGSQKMTDYRLHPEKSGYYLDYNNRVNPGVLNEFSTAAFRVGHTMVPGHFPLLDKNFLPTGSLPLLEAFHNISMTFVPGMCDSLIRGLLGTRLNGMDMNVDEVLIDKLFERRGVLHSGQDLVSRNIARARDHGIPPFVKYKAACGGGVASKFEDLRRTMSQNAINALRQIYAHVDDIDLFVGGLAEDPVPGGLVGPTFACIIAYQFLNARRGDRFWYENPEGGFTPAQLHAIRSSASFARVLCDTMDHESKDPCSRNPKESVIPLRAFFIPSHVENPLWRCDRIQSVDFSLWAENHIKEPVACSYLGTVYQWNKFVQVSPCLICICQIDGELKCEPNLKGCAANSRDEFCLSLCYETTSNLI
ncbi:peroxidase-like isoform X2 [Macrobrachium nipponense]|uniref:peroxidase-like isoform X2 n=1 Tax=Macrobrachium nipponense TaxID=159736 RepID=UPI0030C86604